MSQLWQGTWATRLRIASGLVLFAYVLLHFLNIGLGLFSADLQQGAQDLRLLLTRSGLGSLLLYAALLGHSGLALYELATRRSLAMPPDKLLQYVLGLSIPILLLPHLIYTRLAHERLGVDDSMALLQFLLWDSADGWKQSLLLLIVWVHGCIGLHLWLRSQGWWRRMLPTLIGLATLIPGFALAGFLTQGRQIKPVAQDPDRFAAFLQMVNWPDQAGLRMLATLRGDLTTGFLIVLAGCAGIFALRRILSARRSVPIRYVDGPKVSARKGLTLLEMSQAAGVSHTSLCGGRGRCTTCRVVVEDGADTLDPPGQAERRSLDRVNAPDGTRLACMIRPTQPLSVHRVFRADGKRRRAHASQGTERQLAILFLDMRGFTGRTTGQLPYDVVFLLNRFFDAIVPAITNAGGRVDKYMGDGLLAVFETADAESSARAALDAATGIGEALVRFNEDLAREGDAPVRLGIGLHLGDVVLGEIGAAGNAPRTIIGDSVNTASRLESHTKEMGVELLVSEPLLRAAQVDTQTLRLEPLQLRGLRETTHAWAVSEARSLSEQLAEICPKT
ncbi:MAG: adenylate/guanylate cyclase domain-containing protein [Marinibacterium sp.]|nr:adenylate/guanylate cyclase domain-containing protein [Marinibacterium sp.]